MNWLLFLDYAGVAVFAATGALAASRRQLDIIAFGFLASFTGVGGGTIRDLILGNVPVFWIKTPTYIVVCIAVAFLVYLTAHKLESRYRALLWLDAVGLALFSATGAAIGFGATQSPIIAIVTGMLSATFGGILRDVISGEPSVIMRPEIYVTAAMAGATTFTVGILLHLDEFLAILVAVIIGLFVRGGALQSGWTLPRYKSKSGRVQNAVEKEGISRPQDE